jgi:replicative DNA helicase
MNEPITPELFKLSSMIDSLIEDSNAINEAVKSGNRRGIMTGLGELDDVMGGFFAPGLHVVQGAPGCGKTAFALQIAADCHFPALYISAEMPLMELFRRLIANKTDTFLGRLKSGEIYGEAMRQKALATAQSAPNLAMMDAGIISVSPDDIKNAANVLRDHAAVNHILIVIDSLQVWARTVKPKDGAASAMAVASEYDRINGALDVLSNIGKTLNCPILAISHRNRVGNRGASDMHSGKGSGDIEYATETVIDLNKDQEQPDGNGDTIIKAMIHKNRHGVSGVSFKLKFTGRVQRFVEM